MINKNDTITSDQVSEPEKVLVRDGIKEFNHYIAQFNKFAPRLNAFAEKVELELPDLKIKFSKALFQSFYSGWAENEIAQKINDFANSQPHSLKDYIINWHWEKLNILLEDWEQVAKWYQLFSNPVNTSYPSEALDIEGLPFDENGRLTLAEAFKCEIRDYFNQYVQGENAREVLALLQRMADVFNEMSERIETGKSHPKFDKDTLSRSKPFFINIDENGVFKPHWSHINFI